jgi:hypothetical protein
LVPVTVAESWICVPMPPPADAVVTIDALRRLTTVDSFCALQGWLMPALLTSPL